ncbi:hypothetical protein PX554_19910 [Sphingomonas sp. H39-1-10]|uniref:hypothetical protein n=1 Tax=Sphingomonas pollutisoli TaxID=3030829 RepID=UPI0023B9E2BC|nr:hypothetical protein [Sphingomonas pollutisoli]MDF0490398.1 hypothetical protein [Sphingomonas pollutisoli]
MTWLVRNQSDRALFWSGAQRWVDIACEDLAVFDDRRKASSTLPMGGEWVDKDHLADSSGSTARLDIKVQASAHSDDYRIDVDFDAAPWFAQASEQDILELAQCEWGGDYPADSVALHMAEQNTELQRMFDYISIAGTERDPVGFECYVDGDDARAWLNQQRPHLLPIIARMDEENERTEDARKAIETALKTIGTA